MDLTELRGHLPAQRTKALNNPTIFLTPDVLAQEIVVPQLTSLGTTPSQG
jgi:hypothetical protein